MTNNQALTVSNYCQLLYASKQITFGIATKLSNNGKHYSKIMEQVEEIKKLGKERETPQEEIKKELLEFGNAEFEGTFKTIDFANIENLSYETIPVSKFNGEQENWLISDLFLVLQELNIVQ